MVFEQSNLLHTPEGVRDIYNGECGRKLRLKQDIQTILYRYGYQGIETPMFEFFDIFNKERGTVSSKEMFKFFDREGNTLVLRPDMTPPIARCAAKYFKDETLPLRLSYEGETFINNSSHQGKLNETTQVGGELLNDASVNADAEVLAVTIDCLLKTGLKEFQIEVGHAQFFNGIMEEASFAEEEIVQIKNLMESKNEFGMEDFVGSRNLPADLKELLRNLPKLFGTLDNLDYAKKLTKNERALKALDRIERLLSLMDLYGYKDYITVDLGMLSRYNYYTGMIMKAYTYGNGESIAQGGRYDNLVGQFGKKAPAVGFVIIADQLMLALSRQKLTVPMQGEQILLLYDGSRQKDAIQKAEALRREEKNVAMMLRSGDASAEDYRQYAARHGFTEVITMDGGGEAL